MATYSNCLSLALTYRWAAKSTSPWAGEVWQTGLRLLVRGTGVDPTNAGRVTPTAFEVQDASVSRTADIWAIQQGFSGAGGAPYVITDADIDDILGKTKTWLEAFDQFLDNSYEFESVRIYPMLGGGGTPFKAGKTATAPIIASPTGTTVDPEGSGLMPPDVATAVSLVTGTRGPSGRGRMFLGGLIQAWATTTGLVQSGYAQATVDATRAYLAGLRDINSGAPGGAMRFTPVIYTKVPNVNGENADTASVIASCRMSDEFDTQRRRDHQRKDTYVVSAAV